jgi:glycosyltransferase involved in cell wall biosynthesis
MPDAMLFTVFTPIYNRAHTLHRVYDSLRAQTLRDFEWIVVDDGSTDNTAESWRILRTRNCSTF